MRKANISQNPAGHGIIRTFTGLSPLTLFILGLTLFSSTSLRMFQPLLLPMFHDEGLHISRAQRVLSEHTLLMGTEGGKYLQVWLLALILPLNSNPLLTARLLSATVGLLAGIGCFLLARQLYRCNYYVALIATILYAVTPYLLFFDRMALADGLLSALAVWSLLLSLLVIKQPQLGLTLMLGVCLGMACATKLNGVLFLTFPVCVWLVGDRQPSRRHLILLPIVWMIALPWLLPALFEFLPQYKSTVSRSWIDSTADGISHSTRLILNLQVISTTLWTYLTPPLFLLTLAEIARGWRQRDRATRLLLLAALVTLIFFFLTAGVDQFFPRYILPAFPFLIIMAARNLVALTNWPADHVTIFNRKFRPVVLAGLVLLVSLPALRFDYQLLTTPPRAAWLALDRWQYINGWPAGYGVVEATVFLREQADELGQVIVVKSAENQSGTGIWTHYLDQSNILLQAIRLRDFEPQALGQMLRNAPAPVFVIFDRPSEDQLATDLIQGNDFFTSNLLATFPRPGNVSRIEVYLATPKP